MQGVEVRHPVEAKDHSFAVDHKPLLPVFQCGFNNPWQALGPIIPAARDQPDPVAVTLYAEAVTVVKPLGASGHGLADGGQAELGFPHAAPLKGNGNCLGPPLRCHSTNLSTNGGTSKPSMAQRWAISSAISADTSRDQPLAVLNATIRTESEYCPSSMSVMTVCQLVRSSPVSRRAEPKTARDRGGFDFQA
jgi:hypothetical protein